MNDMNGTWRLVNGVRVCPDGTCRVTACRKEPAVIVYAKKESDDGPAGRLLGYCHEHASARTEGSFNYSAVGVFDATPDPEEGWDE